MKQSANHNAEKLNWKLIFNAHNYTFQVGPVPINTFLTRRYKGRDNSEYMLQVPLMCLIHTVKVVYKWL